MRQAKQNKINRRKKNEENKARGRTRQQHNNLIMKKVVFAYDGRLGKLVGETLKERYEHLHELYNEERRRIAEEKKKEEEKNGS